MKYFLIIFTFLISLNVFPAGGTGTIQADNIKPSTVGNAVNIPNVQVDNVNIDANTVKSISGDLVLDAASSLKPSKDFIPNSSTLNLGSSGSPWQNLYTSGEAFGLKIENVTSGTMPTSSATKKGRLVYTTDTKKLYVDDGSSFILASGAGGGISGWATTNGYVVDDIVHINNKIYKCLVGHTAGTFATDLAAGKWVELSPMDGVDLTTNQTIGGIKTFSSTISGSINGNASTVTTNANLTGPITSSGNTTSIASQTGTGSTFAMSTSPQFSTSIAVGGAANANAIADFQSTTKAFMPPRMTTTQKNAIASPTAGMVVYDTTLNAQSTYDGTTWQTGLGTITVDTDWTACTFSTLAWQGLGTVTNTSLQCRRQGSNLEMKGTVTVGTASGSTVQIPLPSNYGTIVTQSSGSAESYGLILRNIASPSTVLNAISTAGLGYFQVSGVLSVTTNNPAVAVAGTTASATGEVLEFQNIKIPISGWSSNGATYSGANANYDFVSYDPQSGSQGFGTLTNKECMHARDGGDLLLRCKFTAGTVTASEARIPLPNSLTSASTTRIPSIQLAGPFNRSSSASYNSVFIEPSVSYVTFGVGALAKVNGSAIISTGETVSFTARVPISTWSNVSQVMANIAGYSQLNGAAGSATPNVEHFILTYGATATSDCTANAVCAFNEMLVGTGATMTHGVPTGIYTLGFPRTYVKAKCLINAVSGTTKLGSSEPIRCSSCSSVSITTETNGGTDTDSHGTVECDGVY